jgi:hypothetical protein
MKVESVPSKFPKKIERMSANNVSTMLKVKGEGRTLAKNNSNLEIKIWF